MHLDIKYLLPTTFQPEIILANETAKNMYCGKQHFYELQDVYILSYQLQHKPFTFYIKYVYKCQSPINLATPQLLHEIKGKLEKEDWELRRINL